MALTDTQIRALKIRKDVPVPPRAREAKPWPFRRMKVNHSFTFPIDAIKQVDHAARRFALSQRPRWAFATRALSDKEGGVWRVK